MKGKELLGFRWVLAKRFMGGRKDMAERPLGREHWKTRIGLVLAMAGNAIGLGNFLRFPGQAAANGGGAFMIPYFFSFILMAIPLMWLEWAQGRYGGARGHGTTPGMFDAMWKHPVSKYLGVLGLFIPTVILFYYAYIGSWTLGYSLYSLFGKMPQVNGSALHPGMSPQEITETVLKPFDEFRKWYVGDRGDPISLSPPLWPTLTLFSLVWVLSIWLLARGVAEGIELLAKIGMPILFALAVVLVVRIFTLGHPVSEHYGPMDGVAFLWEPKWFIQREGTEIFVLFDGKTWLAAAGQIFFTLSLGMGAIQCYASYLREKDDVMLTGLSTTSANEFAEVVLGASIAIPAASAFFGVSAAQRIAGEGSFYLGFVSMPAIFGFLPAGNLLGFLWFILLFLAALTSIVAMAQPMMAFLQDEFGLPRQKAAFLLGGIWLVSVQLCLWLNGAWQVMDFWAGTFGPPLFALIEVIVMMWFFGGERMWEEMHRGAQLRAPRFFYYSARYITPLFLLAIFGAWVNENLIKPFREGKLGRVAIEGVKMTWVVWVTRLYLLLVFIGMCLAVWWAWRERGKEEGRTTR